MCLNVSLNSISLCSTCFRNKHCKIILWHRMINVYNHNYYVLYGLLLLALHKLVPMFKHNREMHKGYRNPYKNI